MRTEFRPAQLADPQLREADSILRKCVRCGFCNTACPTFALTGNELDGPRGRIYLIKDLLERDAQPSAQVVRHIDSCLSCLSCNTACPSGVNYMRLVDLGRAQVEARHQRPLRERLTRALLAAVLPYPARFRLLLALAGLAAPYARLLPARLRAALRLRTQARQKPARAQPHQAHRPPATPSASPTPMALGLMAGCVQQTLGRHINEATVRLLERQGYRVQLLSSPACCGAIEHHLGQTASVHKRLRRNVIRWTQVIHEASLQALLVNASGCGLMLKEYGHLLRHEPSLQQPAAALSAATQDLAEFLHAQAPLRGRAGLERIRVACHNPCAMQHGQQLRTQAPELLRQVGFTVQPLPEQRFCCGSAGAYNLLQPVMAERLGRRKAAQIDPERVDVVASGNLGCILQLRQFTTVPVAHTVELLDWATGGSKPF